MDVFVNINLLKNGLKFLAENKGIQNMFKDMDKLNKEIELTMKNADKILKVNNRKIMKDRQLLT
jgi:hypothetical protein